MLIVYSIFKMTSTPGLVTGTAEPGKNAKFTLEIADIVVVVVYFIFVLAVGIWVCYLLIPFFFKKRMRVITLSNVPVF